MSSIEEQIRFESKPGARRSVTPVGTCPSCGRKVRLSGRISIGMEVRCLACGDELQVVDIDPVELDWLYDYDNDFDDDLEDRDRYW